MLGSRLPHFQKAEFTERALKPRACVQGESALAQETIGREEHLALTPARFALRAVARASRGRNIRLNRDVISATDWVFFRVALRVVDSHCSAFSAHTRLEHVFRPTVLLNFLFEFLGHLNLLAGGKDSNLASGPFTRYPFRATRPSRRPRLRRAASREARGRPSPSPLGLPERPSRSRPVQRS